MRADNYSMETFASLSRLANEYLAAESRCVASMEGGDTNHILACMEYLAWCREQRAAIYAQDAWKAGK